jgi:hypothetical protein
MPHHHQSIHHAAPSREVALLRQLEQSVDAIANLIFLSGRLDMDVRSTARDGGVDQLIDQSLHIRRRC